MESVFDVPINIPLGHERCCSIIFLLSPIIGFTATLWVTIVFGAWAVLTTVLMEED